MNPGETIKSFASITRAARVGETLPISATRPSLIATSALNQGLPVPSTTRPPEMIRSNSACADAARRLEDRAATTTSKAKRSRVLFRIEFGSGKAISFAARRGRRLTSHSENRQCRESPHRPLCLLASVSEDMIQRGSEIMKIAPGYVSLPACSGVERRIDRNYTTRTQGFSVGAL